MKTLSDSGTKGGLAIFDRGAELVELRKRFADRQVSLPPLRVRFKTDAPGNPGAPSLRTVIAFIFGAIQVSACMRLLRFSKHSDGYHIHTSASRSSVNRTNDHPRCFAFRWSMN
jgi:hypothetical protein